MSIKAYVAVACMALASLAASSQASAQGVDAGRFFRAAGAGGGSFARPPRFSLPGRPVVRPDKPRFGGVAPAPGSGRCHGRTCLNSGKVVVTPTCPPGKVRRPGGRGCVSVGDVRPTCPAGTLRRPGRGCVTIGDVNPCPKGTHRLRGRCIPNATPDNDGPVVVLDPGKACKAGFKRRGRTCVSVPPLPPRVIDPSPDDYAHDDRHDDRPRSSGGKGKSRPPVAGGTPPIPPDVRVLMTDRPFRPGELVVLVARNGDDSAIEDLTRRYELVAEERHRIVLAGGTVVRFSIANQRPLAQVLAEVSRDPRVLLSQPNYGFAGSDAGATQGRALQYAPSKIRLPEAHAIARGRGTRLAILDTGIDAQHVEIKGAIVESFDSLEEGLPQAEPHGTAITGIISARARLDGIAPEAEILSVRAFASRGEGGPKSTSVAIVKGIDWAFANKARLFNLSFAGPDDPLLARVIAEASSKGAIFVAASGNGGPKAAPAYPAAYKDVIAVTATDESDSVFEMATGGSHVAVAAPGVDILAPAPGGGYDMSSGTSLAAAHVTGVIALMLEEDPALSLVDVRTILSKTAYRILTAASGKPPGRIDAAAAASATVSLRVGHPPGWVPSHTLASD